MKKALIAMFLIGAVIPVFAGTFMVEQWGPDSVDLSSQDWYELEVSFEVEQPALVSVVYGFGYSYTWDPAKVWLTLDDDKIDESEMEYQASVISQTFTYYTSVDQGVHSLKLVYNTEQVVYLLKPRIQVMVFDESQSSVTESPPDEQPGIQPRSILSTGPSVIVPGVTGVYDETGSKVDCQISGDRVYLAPLPAGTYFVSTRETASATKVTKVY